MPKPIPPFTDDHNRKITEALRAIADAKDLVSRAKACDGECGDRLEMLNWLENVLTSYRDKFTSPIIQ